MTRIERRGAGLRIHFAEGEAGILGSLARQLGAVFDDEADPARARLLPSAYPDDAEADAEFRRWTSDDLVDRKSAAARGIADAIGTDDPSSEPTSIDLGAADADGWARALTDLRVTLASRLGIESDDDAVPNTMTGAVYEWLGHLQWTLVETLDELDGVDPADSSESADPEDPR